MTNTFNLEDSVDSRPWIFFFIMCLCPIYVGYRFMCLRIMERDAKLKNLLWKKLMCALPVLFAISLAVRTLNHALDNACWEFTPFSYLMRLFVHLSLCFYQVRGVLLISCFTKLARHPRRRDRVFYVIVFCLAVPVVSLVVYLWVAKLGIPMEGICTLGGGSVFNFDGKPVSVWVFTFFLLELCFLVSNCVTELYLKQRYIPKHTKQELRRATRISTVMLFWDAFFRWHGFNFFLELFVEEGSSLYTTYIRWYSLSFAAIYVAGVSCLLAHSLELTRVQFFRLKFFSTRFWRLAWGNMTLSDEDVLQFAHLKRADRERSYEFGGRGLSRGISGTSSGTIGNDKV